MDDRIAEIREAYDEALADWNGEIDGARPESFALVFEMARDHIALLDSDALIIRRDEDGEWPEWAILAWDRWWLDPTEPGATALFDALASSQGVEP